MGILIGPTPWWQSLVVSTAPVGTSLPDGSRLICKAGGTAWIVAPASTQVGQLWPSPTGGNKCCVCDWTTLNSCLINCGFNTCDWFVPSISQLQNPGYVCRTQWDSISCCYWSSTEYNSVFGCFIYFTNGCPGISCLNQANCFCVRAFRCVTY